MILLTQSSTGRVTFDASGDPFYSDYKVVSSAISTFYPDLNIAMKLNCIIDTKYYLNVQKVLAFYLYSGVFNFTTMYSDAPSYPIIRKVNILISNYFWSIYRLVTFKIKFYMLRSFR